MLFSLLISYKEMLEASLIIGSIYLHLKHMKRNSQIIYLYVGTIGGILCSVLLILASFHITNGLNENIKNVIQGFSLFLISILLLVLIDTADQHKKHNRLNLIKNIHFSDKAIGVLLLSFFIEFKEGIELSIINLANLNKSLSNVMIATLFGILLAVLSAYLLFMKADKINEQDLFKFTSIFLIITTGLMLCEGIFTFLPGKYKLIKPYSDIAVIIIGLLIYYKNNINTEKTNEIN